MFSVIIPASIDSIFFDTIYDLGVTSFHSSVQWDVVKCLLILLRSKFCLYFSVFPGQSFGFKMQVFPFLTSMKVDS